MLVSSWLMAKMIGGRLAASPRMSTTSILWCSNTLPFLSTSISLVPVRMWRGLELGRHSPSSLPSHEAIRLYFLSPHVSEADHHHSPGMAFALGFLLYPGRSGLTTAMRCR